MKIVSFSLKEKAQKAMDLISMNAKNNNIIFMREEIIFKYRTVLMMNYRC
jgi:hypothetical protein